MSLVVAVLWLLATAASAAPANARVTWKPLPSAEEHGQMNAGEYYDVLVVREYGRVERVVERVRVQATSGDPTDIDASYEALQQTLEMAVSRLAEFPPWKNDSTLTDAVIGAYGHWRDTAQKERDEAAPLTIQTPLSDKDMKKFEHVRKQLDAEWAKSNEAVRKVIVDFAEAERLVFKANADIDGSERFAPPGLPPANSDLEPVLWTSKAIAYHNALHADSTRMADAMNAMASKMNSPDLQAARKVAIEKVKPMLDDAEQFGPLGGDDTYRNAVVAYGKWMLGQLEGPLKEHADLTEDGTIDADDIARLDEISDGLAEGAGVQALALDEARKKFLQFWHVEDYIAWRKTQKKR